MKRYEEIYFTWQSNMDQKYDQHRLRPITSHFRARKQCDNFHHIKEADTQREDNTLGMGNKVDLNSREQSPAQKLGQEYSEEEIK